MTPSQANRVAIAVIRVLPHTGADPVIRVIEMRDLFGTEHVLTTTSSPDEAADLIRRWLQEIIGTAHAKRRRGRRPH